MDPDGPLARRLRIAIAVAALAGALACGTLLAITFLVPDAVERAAQAFVRHEVTASLRATLAQPRVDAFASAARRLRQQLADESATLRRLREAPFEAHVQVAIDRLCRRGCQGRLQPALDRDLLSRHYGMRLARNDAALDRVTEWIQGRYVQTVRDLTREVRIFLGCNALLFAIVVLLALFARAPGRALLVPAASLFVGTAVAAAIWLVGQDWLYALIHDTFVGWTYAAWCAGMALICLDLAITRAAFTLAALGVAAEGFASVAGLMLACLP